MKILFCLFARLGDVCAGIPAYLALRKKFPKADLNWITLKRHAPLTPRCGKTLIHNVPPFGDIPRWASAPDYDIIIKAQPMWRHGEWESSRKHIIDLICQWSGVKPDKKEIIVEVSDSDAQVARAIAPRKPFVTICSSPCYSWHDWPIPKRQKLANYVRSKGFKVMTIGGKDGVKLDGAIEGHGKLSCVQSVALISMSRLYIGPDTGTTWLACAARNVPKLCLIDRSRLKMGVTGFEKYIDNDNIRDSFYQDDYGHHVKVVDQLLELKSSNIS